MASRPALPRPAGPDQVSLARWGSDSGYGCAPSSRHVPLFRRRISKDHPASYHAACTTAKRRWWSGRRPRCVGL
jgi:hypothetical protein